MHLLWLLLALSTFTGPLPQASNACPVGGQPGVFSKYSVELCFQDPDTRHLDIPSPNGSARYVVNGDHGQFYVRGKAVGKQLLVGNDEEWIWSPDSQAIISTMCFSAEGVCSAGVGYIDGRASPVVPDVMQPIRRSFVSRHPRRAKLACGDAVDVGGLGWLDNSQALFLSQIASSPHCGDDWGYFDVYIMSFPGGKILRVYPMAEALKRFRRFLGPGLRRNVPKLRQKPDPTWDTN